MVGSWSLLLSIFALPPSFELGGKPVETPFPDGSVCGDELRQLLERLRAQRVQTPPAFRPDDYEVGFLEDRQLPRDAGLADVDDLDQLVDRALAAAQRVDDAAPGRVGQDPEHIGHADIILQRHISSQQYFVM